MLQMFNSLRLVHTYIKATEFRTLDHSYKLRIEELERRPLDVSGDQLKSFVDTMDTCNLSQYNGECNVNKRILVLVFSNSPLSIDSCLDPLVPVDRYHK